MTTDLQEFIKNTNKIIVDTNLFLLYLGGLHNLEIVEKLKSTKNFFKEDFETLHNILDNYKQITTTPHILTEFGNLNKDKLSKNNYYRKELFRVLQLLLKTKRLDEKFITISELVVDSQFKRLGVADTAIGKLSKEKSYGVITTDLDLYLHLEKNNIECFNFTNLTLLSH